MKALIAAAFVVSITMLIPIQGQASVGGGVDSLSDPLYISANGTPVITVTGATKNALFAGPIDVVGVARSAAFL